MYVSPRSALKNLPSTLGDRIPAADLAALFPVLGLAAVLP